MSDKPHNRIFDEQPGKDGIEFEPLREPFTPQAFAFALVPHGDKLVFKTPFGVIKISMATSEELAQLGHELGEIFTKGLTANALQRLTQLVATIPAVQEMLKQAPELGELLEQALVAFREHERASAAATGISANGTSPQAGAAAALEAPFRPGELSFSRCSRVTPLN